MEIDQETSDELDKYGKHCKHLVEKNRAAKIKKLSSVGGSRSSGATVSITPKKNPHVGRIKIVSRYNLSPYDKEIKVSEEVEDMYKKLMVHSGNPNSSIKK